jgi:hypothetical protein
MNTIDSTGLRLDGEARPGRAGHWWRATTATAGGVRGALLLDPSAIAAPGALDRLVSTVVATRSLPGVLPIADLLTDSGRVWLITAAPATPTVAELLASPHPIIPSGVDLAAVAATIALDSGNALAHLHRCGAVHGGFGPDTIVVTPPGTASLIEVGLVPALRAESIPPALDGWAWAELARTLAERLASGATADLLRRAAGIVESANFETALRIFASEATSLGVPVPYRGWLATTTAPQVAPTEPAAQPQSQPPPLGTAARTLLPQRGSGREPARAAAEAMTRLGRRAGNGQPAAAPPQQANLRFGPGADTRPGARPATATRRRRRRGRLRTIASALLTLAILAGVGGYLWWQRQNPLVVTAAVVAPAQPPGEECDVTVDVVGTVQTNGRGGTVTYQWVRSDGEASAVLDQSVPNGSGSTQVHLFWSFSGEGSYDATATLKILAPTPMEASGEFTYRCG